MGCEVRSRGQGRGEGGVRGKEGGWCWGEGKEGDEGRVRGEGIRCISIICFYY